MSARERAARAAIHALLRRVRGGVIELREPDGSVLALGAQAPPPAAPLRVRVDVHSPAAYVALALHQGVGLGRSYMEGLWSCDDLVTLVRIAARAMEAGDRVRERLLPLVGPAQRTAWRLRANTRARSRERIAAHYDLGNELFSRFLDETMMYSCGIFERPDATLHEASVAKLERVCRTLDLGPDDHVLEIGTGWGGFALHAAGRHGCRVTTTTISRAQHEHAVAAVRAAGLSDRVEVLLEDYRDLRGSYDKLVSIEMIEAVGWEHLDAYFAVCAERLKPDGAMLLQAIVASDRAFRVERASVGFINAFVFPGARCRRWRRSNAPSAAPTCAPCGWRTSPPTTSRRCGRGARTSSPPGRNCASTTTTSASAASGSCISLTARPASPSAGSRTSR